MKSKSTYLLFVGAPLQSLACALEYVRCRFVGAANITSCFSFNFYLKANIKEVCMNNGKQSKIKIAQNCDLATAIQAERWSFALTGAYAFYNCVHLLRVPNRRNDCCVCACVRVCFAFMINDFGFVAESNNQN